MNGHGVGQGMLVGVLEQDGEDLHTAGLAVPGPSVHGALQSTGTVRGILPCLSSVKMTIQINEVHT